MFKSTHSKVFGKAFGLAALGAAVAVPLAFTATPAQAATSTGTLTVTATVQASCSIGNATLAFGTIPDLSAATNGSTTFDVNCTKTTPYSVAMGDGVNGGGTDTTRAMSDGTDTLNYQLYTDSGYSDVWVSSCSAAPADPAPSATDCAYGVGSGIAQTINVYGTIAAGQNVGPSAAYSDTVTMTVTY